MWCIDLLLSKDLETDNETTDVAVQWRRVGGIQPVAGQLQQLYYSNGKWKWECFLCDQC
jgi:hypothetical protein